MKKLLSILVALGIVLLIFNDAFSQCNDGQITCYGNYTVTDSQTPVGDYYLVYMKVSNLCPSTTGWFYLATLTSVDLGSTQNYNNKIVDIGIPTGDESYYYWTIYLHVDKYVNNEIVDSKDRSVYAGRSGSSLTAYNSISLPFN